MKKMFIIPLALILLSAVSCGNNSDSDTVKSTSTLSPTEAIQTPTLSPTNPPTETPVSLSLDERLARLDELQKEMEELKKEFDSIPEINDRSREIADRMLENLKEQGDLLP